MASLRLGTWDAGDRIVAVDWESGSLSRPYAVHVLRRTQAPGFVRLVREERYEDAREALGRGMRMAIWLGCGCAICVEQARDEHARALADLDRMERDASRIGGDR